MKKTLALLLAAMMLLTALAGCAKTETPDQETTTPETTPDTPVTTEPEPAPSLTAQVPDGSDITIVMGSDLVSLFPIDTANTMDGGIEKLLMDNLVGFTDDYQLVWMLASGYQANDDSTEYTFALRKGIKFSDGEAWNAEACKANLDIFLNQELGYKKNSNFKMISSVEAVDEYTVKVTLNRAYGAFLNVLAHPSAAMMSPAQLSKGAEACTSQPVGTGQYTLKEWRPGEQWVLELNPNWWGYNYEICGGEALVPSNAGFNSITFKPVTEAATRIAMMLGGQADFLSDVASTYVETLTAAGVSIDRADGLSITYFYMNNTKPFLSDAKVRQAISKAIDIPSMIQVCEGGYTHQADSFIAPSVSYYKGQGAGYTYDLEGAKALMSEAGYAGGFTIKCWTQNTTSGVQRAEFIQQQLAQIGITLEIVPNENGTLSSGVNGYSGDPAQTEWDCYIRGFSPSTGDADQGLGRFASSMWPNVGSNFMFYSNEEFDKLIEDGSKTPDPDARTAAYSQAQDIIWADAPAIPLFYASNSWAYNNKVQGIRNYADGSIFLRDAVYVG